MKRWTDGRTWSPSRVLGSFLTYRELDIKHRRRQPSISSCSDNDTLMNIHPKSTSSCAYRKGGLIKQSFSICTANNQKIHLISYYTKEDVALGRLEQPSQHSQLRKIVIPKSLYPKLTSLEISTGQSSTFHSIRKDIFHSFFSRYSVKFDALSTNDTPIETLPSLTASPMSSDEDMEIAEDLYKYSTNNQCLPVRDTVWSNLSCSEDKRQLRAIETLLRI
ncbi:Gti1/Pac2 family-domain-containing protein [Spinellus fusiger]|nr:Gti1/Pac2 family-domain-containing protein [Spinellus fusiger]